MRIKFSEMVDRRNKIFHPTEFIRISLIKHFWKNFGKNFGKNCERNSEKYCEKFLGKIMEKIVKNFHNFFHNAFTIFCKNFPTTFFPNFSTICSNFRAFYRFTNFVFLCLRTSKLIRYIYFPFSPTMQNP